MLLNDGTVGLFPFGEEESTQYREWVNNEEFAHLLARCSPVTESQHSAWYQSIISSPTTEVFAVKTLKSGHYLGNVWLHGINWVHRNAELRILIGKTQGKGYGTKACQLLLKYSFKKLGLHKVYLYVSDVNPRAHKAFEKAGFIIEGELKDEFFLDGEFVNVKRMAAFAPV